MQPRHQHNLTIRTVLCSALTLGMLALATAGGSPASATTVHVKSKPITLNVTLRVDCAKAAKTAIAQNWLKQHQLCSYAPKAHPGDWIAYGDCGSLSLILFNSNGGYMGWKAEITSSKGPFVAAHYNGYWVNDNTGGSANVSRTGGFSSDWVDVFPIHTGSGFVDGYITSAWDTPVFGILCTNNAVVNNYTYVY